MILQDFIDKANVSFNELCILDRHTPLQTNPFTPLLVVNITLSVLDGIKICRHERNTMAIIKGDTIFGAVMRRMRLNKILRHTLGYRIWCCDGSYLCTALLRTAQACSDESLEQLLIQVKSWNPTT